MDSSISLKGKGLTKEGYVLGATPTVRVYELDMVVVFRGVIDQVKSLLKYLPCFKPLTELLNGGILTGCATRRTDIDIVEFPVDISERTKIVEVQVLEDGDAGSTSVRRSLLLTDKGVLLLWSAVYSRPVGANELCQSTKGRDEVAEESRFEIFDDNKLSLATSQSHLWKVDWRKVIMKILVLLRGEITKCVEERQRYLQSMEETRCRLNGILRRISAG